MGGNSSRQGSGLNGYGATPNFSSPDSGITPAFYLANGFPAYTPPPFFDPGYGAGYNAASPSNASSITYDAPELSGKPAYSQNWNFSIQRQLDASTVLTAAYAASNSHRLPTGIGRGIYSNQILPQYLSLGGLASFPSILRSERPME